MVELRPVEALDRERLLAWRNDPSVSGFMYDDHVISDDEHDLWFIQLLKQDRQRGWTIQLDGKPVGAAFISAVDRRHQNAMWAFYLADESVRGRGVGKAVEVFVLQEAFEQMDLHKLSCEVLGFNSDVIAMHESFGFKHEGVFREDKWKNGGWQDVHRLAMLRDDWRALRTGILARLGGSSP